MNYNQLKSYITSQYNTLLTQVDARNWSGSRTSLANIKREVDLFIVENPTHPKVVLNIAPDTGDGTSIARDLSDECINMTNKVNDIEWYVSANSEAVGFQTTYDEAVATLKVSLKRTAEQFAAV
jgi:hypothetical protein